MAMKVDQQLYTKVPYIIYDSLQEKIGALFRGEILYLKNFEKGTGADVLIRIEQKKFAVSQISYDVYKEPELNPRYWITFNVGLNDLSLFTAIKFEEGMHKYTNKYMINDIVQYENESGVVDSAIIEEVYVLNTDYNIYAYKLSREEGLYAEEDLIQHVYMWSLVPITFSIQS